MRILHVIANLATRYGGPSQAIIGMSKSLAEIGNKVTIFTTNQDGDGVLDVPINIPVLKDGVEIRYFPIQNPRFFGTSFPMARALKKGLKNKDYDIVHIHSLYLFHGAVAAHYCRRYKIPYIIRPHGTLDPFLYQRNRMKKAIIEFLFENRNIKHAIALHYTTEEEKILARPFINNDRGFVVPNGLYLDEYDVKITKGQFRERFPETKGKKIILFFSRLNFKKGLDLLIQAFDNVAQVKNNVHLVITGPDNDGYGENVKKWIKERNLDSRVTFTGMLTGQGKLQVLYDADMFVLPSYSENFGISVIEAMICGLPVIVSNKVNIYRELLKNNAGEVVNCDADELTMKILKLLDDSNHSKLISDNGKKLVEEYYQWSMVGQSLDNNYRMILNG